MFDFASISIFDLDINVNRWSLYVRTCLGYISFLPPQIFSREVISPVRSVPTFVRFVSSYVRSFVHSRVPDESIDVPFAFDLGFRLRVSVFGFGLV